MIKIIFLISLCLSTLSQAASKEEEYTPTTVKLSSSQEESPYPIFAFKINKPDQSSPKEIYLVGSIHAFPYENYPDWLKSLFEKSKKDFLLVLEHGEEWDDSFGQQTDQDEPWSLGAVQAKYEAEKTTLSLNLSRTIESILHTLPEYSELKFPYALLLAYMNCDRYSHRYDEGLDEILIAKFKTQKYLESIKECFEELITFKSFSEFKFSSLEGEVQTEEEENTSYQTAFDISLLEKEQKQERLENQLQPSIFGVSEEKHIKRNLAWVAPINAIMAEHNKAFVVVGVNHLISQHGLLSLLQNRGATFERLWSDGRLEPFTYAPDY